MENLSDNINDINNINDLHINTFLKPSITSKELFNNFISGKINLDQLIKDCIHGKIPPEFRSILYKIFLNIIPFNEPHNWIQYLQTSRANYYNLVDKYIYSVENILEFINCPTNKGSPEFEKYRELLSESDFDTLSLIKIDVARTFQDTHLFYNNNIKEILCKILYIFAKTNSDPSYIQGMNEILATILYAFYPSVTFDKDEVIPKTNEDYYDYLTNENYFEADLYIVYDEIMSRDIKELFTYNDDRFKSYNNVEFDKYNLSLEKIEESEESEINKRVKKIFYIYLKKIDLNLFNLLVEEIEPKIFMLRWLLCIFNREFCLKNTLWIWDCILAYEFIEFTLNEVEVYKNRFNFMDYICVAMILSLREECLNCENGFILNYFMHFNKEDKIDYIIKAAVKICVKLNDDVDLFKDNKLKLSLINK